MNKCFDKIQFKLHNNENIKHLCPNGVGVISVREGKHDVTVGGLRYQL
jgi:hypothetical protein